MSTHDRGAPISPMRQRLLQGAGAQIFAKAVDISIRLTEIPLFLYFWGPQLYGEWLILTTIPTYLAIADLGFSGAASRQMTLSVAAGKRATALGIFQTMTLFIGLLSVIILGIVLIILSTLPVADWFNLSRLSGDTVRDLLLILTLYTIVNLFANFFCAAFSSVGIYGLVTFLISLVRLIEFLVLAAAIAAGATPYEAALALLTTTFIGTLAIWNILKPHAPWIRTGIRNARFSKLQPLFKPAIAASAVPIGYSLSTQGIRLLIASWFGPQAVTLFASMRTLTRLGSLLTNALHHTIQVELSIAFGKHNQELFLLLYRRSTQIAAWGTALICLILWFAGRPFFMLWTNNELLIDPNAFALLILTTFFNALWYSATIAAYAINKLSHVALSFLAANVAMFAIAIQLGPEHGLTGITAALLIMEIGLSCYLISYMMSLTGESWTRWLHTQASPPWFLITGLRNSNKKTT